MSEKSRHITTRKVLFFTELNYSTGFACVLEKLCQEITSEVALVEVLK